MLNPLTMGRGGASREDSAISGISIDHSRQVGEKRIAVERRRGAAIQRGNRFFFLGFFYFFFAEDVIFFTGLTHSALRATRFGLCDETKGRFITAGGKASPGSIFIATRWPLRSVI